MKDYEKYMKLAVDMAYEGVDIGQSPFGACIVKKDEVISCTHNSVWASSDITAHAEIQAIRDACIILDTIDLSECIIFSTCEPCPMCFSAIHWANIDTIYFGAKIEDAKKFGFNELMIKNEHMKKTGGSKIKIVPHFLLDECIKLFEHWSEFGVKRTY